jgi:hypothetical protein
VLSETESRREPGAAQQSTDTVKFEIAAYYVPVMPTTPSAQERSGQ